MFGTDFSGAGFFGTANYVLVSSVLRRSSLVFFGGVDTLEMLSEFFAEFFVVESFFLVGVASGFLPNIFPIPNAAPPNSLLSIL
jgi:hypothetical protein